MIPPLLKKKLSLLFHYLLPPLRFPSKNAFKILANSPPPDWALAQIGEDLAPLAGQGISNKLLNDTFKHQKEGAAPLYIIRFQVEGRHVRYTTGPTFRKEAPLFIKIRLRLILRALRWLARTVGLPKADFLVSLLDDLNDVALPGPVFVFSKRSDLKNRFILMPDFEALSGNHYILKQIDKGKRAFSWDAKKNKAFWRGLTTGSLLNTENFLSMPRSQLIVHSHQFPDLIDARYNGLCQTNAEEEIFSRFSTFFGPFVSIKDHLQYKYQVLIDGNTCAYSRCYWQLFSDCVIVKQDSINIQWYYRLLRPYEHFIPVDRNLNNLPDRIQWATRHDKEVKEIVLRANDLAKKHLSHAQVLCYLYLLLVEYAKRQNL